MGARGHVRAAPQAEPRRAEVQLHRRPDHREQSDGRAPCLGKDAQGRLPALQGAPRVRPALPERLRLPGPLGRGRGREVARPQLEARDRGVRPGRVRRALPRARRPLLGGDHRALAAPRHVDGLGPRLLHVLRHEHRVHLALPGGGAPPRLAVPGSSLDRLVPALRYVDLAARGLLRRVPRARAPLALRPLPAEGPRGRVARRLDDDAVDAARERRGRREPDRRLRPDRGRRMVGGRAKAGRPSFARRSAASSSGSSTRGRSTTFRRRRASRTA